MSVTKVTDDLRDTTVLDDTKVSVTKGADIASAATVVIGTDGSYFDITGTTGISTQFTVAAGRRFTLQFDGIVTITDNAAITLSGAANFTTAAGDILSFVATAANTVVQTGYSLVDGGSPVAPAAGGGKILQVVNETDGAVATGTTTMPHDDTIPQNSEGVAFTALDTAITPNNSSNKLFIQVTIMFGYSVASWVNFALFQDSTAGALAACHDFVAGANEGGEITFNHYMTAGTTSETTFKLRCGGHNAGTITYNGDSATRRFAGVATGSMTIMEIEV